MSNIQYSIFNFIFFAYLLLPIYLVLYKHSFKNIILNIMQTDDKKRIRTERKELKEKVQKETLKRLYHKSEEERATAIAAEFDLPYIDLSMVPINAETVNSIPKEDALRAELAVVHKVGKKLQIAIANPENYETKKLLEKLKKEDGINYNLVIVSMDGLKRAWSNYNFETVAEVFENQEMSLKKEDLTEFEKGINNIIELKKRISEIHTTEIFNIIIAGAINTK